MWRFVEQCLTFEEEGEAWRSVEVKEGMVCDGYGNFCDNSIKTSKYNAVTFVPRSLFEQFRRTANQYFLLISILMILGSYTKLFFSPLTAYSTIAPLALILALTMGKEGVEDLKRHRSDEKVNNTPAKVVRKDREDTIVPWRDLRPGHVVLLKDREEIPADLVLLSCPDSSAYVETSNIDGETNLKIKKAAGVSGWDFKLDFEPPCGRIHTFEGTLGDIPLDSSHFLLRGSTLRNTKWARGVVCYTGRDTRLVRNSREAPSKLSEMERVVNNMVYFILFSMAVITSISTVAYAAWNSKYKKDLWYLCYRYNHPDVPPLFSDNCKEGSHYATGSLWFTFFILYNNFIPISLYVTIEVINYCQAYYVDNDLRMYDEDSETPALARTSNMNADLGMIKHIFSDKTGTLTRNVMRFERCAVAGNVYGAPDAAPPFRLAALRQLVVANHAKEERDFVTIMAVCHTVVPERKEDGIAYQAESPDEEALVKGAIELGLTFEDRGTKGVKVVLASPGGIDGGGTSLEFEILALIPFDSTRKRMSVVARLPNNSVRVMTKGADTVIKPLAASNFDRLAPHLDAFARDGLRTLVLAQRDISSSEYGSWAEKFRAAETSTAGDRSQKLAAAAALIERDLDVVGATAIEDRLQDGVPETVADLANAGIKIWVLTGDKMETAINIGYSARLLTPDMYLVKMPVENATPGPDKDYGVRRQLDALEALVANAANKSTSSSSAAGAAAAAPRPPPPSSLDDDDARRALPKPLLVEEDERRASSASSRTFASDSLALVIEGSTAVEAILGDPELEDRLLRLAQACRAVVACRVSPAQKRLIVKLVKDASKRTTSFASRAFDRPITLAIGDGANDVGMIQEAQVGVGISGKEGRQAVNNADFAIAQFRFLKLLLLYHGRRNYRRLAKVIVYSFFKNIVLTFVLFYFQSDCGWSGTSFYEAWVYSGFNFFLGLLPFCMGFFDVDISDPTVEKYPRLYAAGLHRMDLNVTNTAYATLEAIAASVLIYFLTREAFARPGAVWQRHGKVADVWVFGTTVFVGMVAAMTARAVLLVEAWNVVVFVCLALQAAMLYTFVLFMSQTSVYVDYDFFGVAYHAFSLGTFWLVSLAVVPATVATLQLLINAVHLEFFPTISDVGKEIDRGHVDGEHVDQLLPLRARQWVHTLVSRFLGVSKESSPTYITRDSLREIHQALPREQSILLGLQDDVSSSFAFDAASTHLGAGAGEDTEAPRSRANSDAIV
ncbi:hypothetical protein CTAYLR_008823 [Chrysophaeum taylorii]|uniref:Phospholipid-transporting ATPase n=1 Tax=Chrysophaeum taylorii TaxID=2483200 RepID=A0AAD7UA56_9STRA|nr:hypothetical protein CTAYLR_008823 [Chrysophaeum taylorii]